MLLWNLPKYYQTKQGVSSWKLPLKILSQTFLPLNAGSENMLFSVFRPRDILWSFSPKSPRRHLRPKMPPFSQRQSPYLRRSGDTTPSSAHPQRQNRSLLSLEDEYGLIDVTIFEDIYRKYAKIIFNQPLLLVTGKISRRDPHERASINATRIQGLP